MFTGIIQQTGTIVAVERRPQWRVIAVDAGSMGGEASVGDSVCVNGACLTATRVDDSRVTFDVGAETLRVTTLGELREGDVVNLEPSLRVGDRLSGHFVSGHVDGVGTVRQKKELAGEVRLEVEVESRLTDLMVLKGSVTVDGISLTIAALRDGVFEVSLIPYTLAVTTMQSMRPGDRANVECDMIGRWVKRLIAQQGAADVQSPLSVRRLEEEGF